jgi:hypothetical protein
MNAPDKLAAALMAVAQPAIASKPGMHDSASDEKKARDRASAAFKTEHIQKLDAQDLLALQTLAGFGATPGVWKTPKAWAPCLGRFLLSIDIAECVERYLSQQPPALVEVLQAAAPERLATLKAEGLLTVTRLALLCFLTPVGGQSARKPLRPPTICHPTYHYWPQLLARAISRRIETEAGAGVASSQEELPGLLRYLTAADLAEFESDPYLRNEIKRLDILTQRGRWWDTPPRVQLAQHTDPELAIAKVVWRKPAPYSPLSDDWLGEIGPRVLWCVEELAPNLLNWLEELPGELTRVNWQLEKMAGRRSQLAQLLQELASRQPWLSRSGGPLVPPFLLKTASHSSTIDPFEWPPRNWDQLQTLSVIVQSTHLFMTLMMTAGRIGEVKTLKPGSIEVRRSGKQVVRGHTYKLRSELMGAQRDWPAPPLLVQCLGQQARLVQAWSMLPESLRKGLPEAPRFDDSRLWVSLARVSGTGGGASAELNEASALKSLASSLGVNPHTGGKWVHPHRFRKTVARLAAIAMWQGPMVLKRLLGHKCIEMTLHYILSDPNLREEAEAVLRELRVMHCADTIEEIHEAMTQGGSFAAAAGLGGGVGGEGGKRITAAVQAESQRLAAQGQVWREGTAYDLALMLTVNGSGWRLVRENVICAKAPGEPGACKAQRYGQPNVSSCKPDCGQRVHLSAGKRDIEVTVRQYIDLCEKAHEESQCLLLIAAFENLDGVIHQYKDIEEQHAQAYARIHAWVQEAQAE